MVTIKKYKNRKFYCLEDKCYVTLKHMRALINLNQGFRVICSTTKNDITQDILAQILVDELRPRYAKLDVLDLVSQFQTVTTGVIHETT